MTGMLTSSVSGIPNLIYGSMVDIYHIIILVVSGKFAFIVVYRVKKMSGQRKVRNKKELTDEELFFILQINYSDH